MSRPYWRFSILQMMLLTALCAMLAGLGATTQRTRGLQYLQGLAFSPDGRWLVASDWRRGLNVWDLSRDPSSPRPIDLKENARAGDSPQLRFVTDDTVAIAGEYWGTNPTFDILMWDIRGNRAVRTISIAYHPLAKAISPNGRWAAVSAADTSSGQPPGAIADGFVDRIDLWDLKTGKAGCSFDVEFGVHHLGFSADGTKLIAVNAPNGVRTAKVQTWDTESGKSSQILEFPTDGIYGFAVAPDGRFVAAQATNTVTRIYDLQTGEDWHYKTGYGYTLEFLPDGQSLMLVEWGGGIRIFEAKTGELVGRFPGSDLAKLVDAGVLAISPDAKLLATGTEGAVQLWDLETFQRNRVLFRDRRFESVLAYCIGLILWCVIWGRLSRRDRALAPRQEPANRQLPRVVRAGINPIRTWARLLGTLMLLGVIWGWLFAETVERYWAWSYEIAYVFLVMTFILSLTAFVFVRAWGPAVIRRWRGVPFERGIRLAERASGVPADRVEFESITVCFFGKSQLRSTVRDDYEEAKKRFAELFGDFPEPTRPLTVLVFERTQWYEAFLGGHVPLAGVYWMGIDRIVLIDEEGSLRKLSEPRRIWRFLLARYLFEQIKGFRPSTILASILGSDLLQEFDPNLANAIHRRLQTEVKRDSSLAVHDPTSMTDPELIRLAIDTEDRQTVLRMYSFQNQCGSLAAFLLRSDDNRRRQFTQFLKTHVRKDSFAESLHEMIGGNAQTFQQQWYDWIGQQATKPLVEPPPAVAAFVHKRMLPEISDPDAPNTDRIQAIRNLGAASYAIGVESLIELLRDATSAEIKRESVWALESISGELHGSDAMAWQQWWEIQRESAVPAENDATDEAIYTASLADEQIDAGADGEEILARFLEPSSPEHEEAMPTESPESDGMQIGIDRMKAVWWLLTMGGSVAVVWWAVATVYAVSWGGLLGVLGGVYVLATSQSRRTHSVRGSIRILLFNFLLCNLISVVFGVVAAFMANHPQVKQILANGWPTATQSRNRDNS